MNLNISLQVQSKLTARSLVIRCFFSFWHPSEELGLHVTEHVANSLSLVSNSSCFCFICFWVLLLKHENNFWEGLEKVDHGLVHRPVIMVHRPVIYKSLFNLSDSQFSTVLSLMVLCVHLYMWPQQMLLTYSLKTDLDANCTGRNYPGKSCFMGLHRLHQSWCPESHHCIGSDLVDTYSLSLHRIAGRRKPIVRTSPSQCQQHLSWVFSNTNVSKRYQSEEQDSSFLVFFHNKFVRTNLARHVPAIIGDGPLPEQRDKYQ